MTTKKNTTPRKTRVVIALRDRGASYTNAKLKIKLRGEKTQELDDSEDIRLLAKKGVLRVVEVKEPKAAEPEGDK